MRLWHPGDTDHIDLPLYRAMRGGIDQARQAADRARQEAERQRREQA